MLDLILLILAMAAAGPGATPATERVEVPAPVTAAPAAETAEARSFTSAEDAPPGHAADPDPAPALPYVAEQQVATGRFLTALEVRPIMAATRASWIAVREFDGQDLVYVTQIWSWRCGLVALHIGINGAAPEPWPLPPCHEDTNFPNALLDGDGLPYRAFPPGAIDTVTVELIYDDLTTDRATFNRQGALIP